MIPTISDADIDGLLAALNPVDGLIVLDAARRAAIRDYEHVHACPGAGKTTLVGLKLILLARKWRAANSGICVLTHTNIAKEEILKRVREDAAGRALLGYPHFVGTIQDFVQTFLAFPACRSKGYLIHRIDDAAAQAFLDRRLNYATRLYLQHQHKSTADLKLAFANGVLRVNVPGNPGTTTPSYQNMMAAKKQAVEKGYFFFSEMYALARWLITANPSVISALRQRFPVVLVDEMQDTQRPQDELINEIFDQAEGCNLQKIGDPDQAIFDGMAGDAPNETFNAAALLAPIPDSSRFTPAIASKIQGLSTRRIALTGSRAETPNSPECTFILYNNETIGAVLPRFSEIVAHLPEAEQEVVKVVGGRAEGGPLSIKSYWPAFDRSRASKAPAPATLCEAVHRCIDQTEGHSSENHNHLRQGLVELLRLGGKTAIGRTGNAIPITLTNLDRYLQQRGKRAEVNALLADLVMRSELSPEHWAAIIPAIESACEIDAAAAAIAAFVAYAEKAPELDDPAVAPGNLFVGANGVRLEVSTIHGVKGETHDATLVLETKFRTYFDLAEMLPFMIDPTLAPPVFDPAHPNTAASIRASFMKRTYVAASRARSLVCMAVHRDRLSAEQEAALHDQRGWAIVDLT